MSGRGIAALYTAQKVEPAGAPFTPTSADNGLSVDGSGKIVLGGPVATPSVLLDNRVIDTAGFTLTFNNSAAQSSTVIGNAGVNVFDPSVNANAGISSLGVFAHNSASNNTGTFTAFQWNLTDGTVDSIRCFTNDFVFFDNVTNANRIHLRRIVDVLQFTPDSFVPMFTFGINSGNFLATGTVTTGQPSGSGAGAMQFGNVIAAAVVLDTTRYWELKIGGVVFKAALLV